MTDFTAKPERTYALVVGIEKYGVSKWNVAGGGPATDALKFAQWLCSRGVPLENIWLCLSPLEENEARIKECASLVKEATLYNLSDIIENVLSQKQGELLYIFWAGHGLITSERERRLFCADATPQNWHNLDLNSLLLLLKSNLFKIRKHIFIIDACANYLLESQGRPTNLGGKTFSSGQPVEDSRQFVLMATREGERAKVNAEGKTGYFSQAVREALEQEENNFWPPNMQVIAEEIKQQFQQLDKRQSPIPTYFSYGSWDGDTVILPLNPFNIPHNIPPSNARKFVGRDIELESLHQLLQDNNIVAITDVTGQGGVGKTELAVQYSWRYLQDYPGGCCWLNLQAADLGTQLVEFAIVNFPNFSIPSGLSSNGLVNYCWRNWLPDKALLVFDNVTDVDTIKSFLPSFGSQFKVLITTRKSNLPYTPLPLGKLQPEAALELLKKLLGEAFINQELEFAEKLCKLVDYVPLGLYQIAALSRKPGELLC